MLVVLPDLGEARQRGARQQAHVADHPADGPRGVGPARESKEEDLVANAPVDAQEGVRRAHVAFEALAQGAAEEPCDDAAARADAGLVVHDLRDAVAGGVFDGPAEAGDVGRGLALAVFEPVVRVQPGAVAGADEALFKGWGGDRVRVCGRTAI